MTQTLLRIDASARINGSVSRDMADKVESALDATQILRRDLTQALPQIDATWVEANFTTPANRTDHQRAVLAQSDSLVAELQSADTLLIAMPIYNFAAPASLKAWMDLVARAGRTFRYTEYGPEGLLLGKRAIVVVASGGVQVGSELDFASSHLRHFLGFIGITDVVITSQDQLPAVLATLTNDEQAA